VGDGCAEGMAPVEELEAGARSGVNDGFVSGRAWGPSKRDALQTGCAPQRPWGGQLASGVQHALQRLPPPRRSGAGGSVPCPAGGEPACAAFSAALAAAPAGAPDAPGARDVLLTVASADDAPQLRVLLRSLAALRLAPRAVVLTLDDTAAAAVAAAATEDAAGVATARLPEDGPLRRDAAGAAMPQAAVKWAAAALALQMGLDVLLVDADTVLLQNPLLFLYRCACCDAMLRPSAICAQALPWHSLSLMRFPECLLL
jgi:hypothetical protein